MVTASSQQIGITTDIPVMSAILTAQLDSLDHPTPCPSSAAQRSVPAIGRLNKDEMSIDAGLGWLTGYSGASTEASIASCALLLSASGGERPRNLCYRCVTAGRIPDKAKGPASLCLQGKQGLSHWR